MKLRGALDRVIRDERGDIDDVPGLAVVIPGVLFVVVAFVLIFGQYANTMNHVQSAAFAAARDASLSGDASSAEPHAVAAAEASLSAGGVNCSALEVTVDASALDTPLGTTGNVTATVTCTTSFSTIQLPGLPTSTTITQTAASPTDPYRERP